MYGFSAYSQVAYSTLPGGGGGTAFYGDVEETANLAGTSTVLLIFGGAINQTVRVSSTQIARADFATSINQTLNVLDVLAATANFATNISEQSSFSSTENGTIVAVGTFADSVQFSDTQSNVITTTLAVFEEINNLYDVTSCRADFVTSISESAALVDAPAATVVFVTNIAESGAFSDVFAIKAPIEGNITERILFTPAASVVITTLMQVGESINTQDAFISAVDFFTAIVESAAFSNTQDRQRIVYGLIDITVNFNAVVVYDDAFIGRVEESIRAAGTASTLVTFNANMNEAIDATVQFITASDITLAIIERVRLSSFVVGAGLWREVANTPTGTWVLVDGGGTTPSGGWGTQQGGTTYPSGGWQPVQTVPN